MSVDTTSTTTTVFSYDDIVPGDIVAVRHGIDGRTEGIVIGSTYDEWGHQVIAVRLDTTGTIQHSPLAHVTRVRRLPSVRSSQPVRTVRRTVYW